MSTLKFGETAPLVIVLRRKLAAHGYGTSGDPANQHFDKQLRTAVRAFQADHGLAVDGIVGPKTVAALDAKPRELPDLGKQTGGDVPARDGPRRINAAGLELIARFEGCRHEVYLCPAKKPTVGIGHLLSAAERKQWPVGTKLSPAQVEQLFRADVARFELAVARLVKVPISDNQFAALVSFAFNFGEGALKKSTLLQKLNEGQPAAAAKQFARWNKAGGEVLKGLTLRRAAEKALFERAD